MTVDESSMSGSRLPHDFGESNLVFIVFYRLRTLTNEEKKQWFRDWADIRSHLPSGLKILTDGYGAFGTPYTGFTVYEGSLAKFDELADILEERTSQFIEKTRTIIGTKGYTLPTSEFQSILNTRPID
jgi:hypothetical protein